MPAPRTLGQLIDDVRFHANCEDTDVVPDSRIKRLLHQGIAELYDGILQARGHEYARVTAYTALVAGQPRYQLPSDFYEALSVHCADVGGESDGLVGSWQFEELEHAPPTAPATRWHRCGAFMTNDVTRLLNERCQSPAHIRWRLGGTTGTSMSAGSAWVELRPTPRAQYVIRLDYVPIAPMFEDEVASSTIDFINGWEDWPVLSAAIALLGREESATAHLRADLARVQQRVADLADSGSANEPERIRDVRGARSLRHGDFFNDDYGDD